MPTHVLVNNLGLTYKGTAGISTATLPDVCKTPSPGGPVPIPYPNYANQASLDKGTTTVKAKGRMIAIKGSEYSVSFGDEAGTAGGVTSSTFKKETAWISYSFDVKMDGKNACRHTDKKFHNHKNTVDLSGNQDPQEPAPCSKEKLQQIADHCNKQMNCDKGPCPQRSPQGTECSTLGTHKHKCCETALKEHAADNPECGIQCELAYDKDTCQPLDKDLASNARSAANKAYNDHKAQFGIDSARENKVWIKAFSQAGGANTFIADVVMGNPAGAYDFKFNCKPVGNNPMERMSTTQFQNYKNCTGMEPEVIACDGRDCSGC